MEDIIKNIANVGFPIAVAIYLLVRMETKIEDLSLAINSLTSFLKKEEWNRKG